MLLLSLVTAHCMAAALLVWAAAASDLEIPAPMAGAALEFTARDEWHAFFSHLCSMHVGQQQLCGLLGSPFLDHRYVLTPTALRRALTHLGPNQRLRRVVRDLITGSTTVNIGVIGTSISWGTGASQRGQTDWFSSMGQALKMLFPKAQIQMHNGCFPGTPSSFANMCHTKMVKPDVDLLFVEYLTNDFVLPSMFGNVKMQAYERLIRKVLKRSKHPAVVLLQMLTWGQSFPANDTKFKKVFHESAEDQYGSMAQYYSLPWLSYRNAVRIDAEYCSPWFLAGWPELTNDKIHPNDTGHRVILDMIVWLLMQTALDLFLQPFSHMDSWYIRQGLPRPMHPGNYEEPLEMCLMDEELRSVVQEEQSQGWAFVNEGTPEKPKTGYVSVAPGSKLVLVLGMSQVLGDRRPKSDGSKAKEEDSQVALLISYLKSYMGMGSARMACDQGCTCKAVDVNAHHSQETSTTFMQLLKVQVSSLDAYNVSVTVLSNSTSPGLGHKFKVTAVMMNRLSALGFHWPDEPAVFLAQDVFSGEYGREEMKYRQVAAAAANPP